MSTINWVITAGPALDEMRLVCDDCGAILLKARGMAWDTMISQAVADHKVRGGCAGDDGLPEEDA